MAKTNQAPEGRQNVSSFSIFWGADCPQSAARLLADRIEIIRAVSGPATRCELGQLALRSNQDIFQNASHLRTNLSPLPGLGSLLIPIPTVETVGYFRSPPCGWPKCGNKSPVPA
jgi:hypothetical protein